MSNPTITPELTRRRMLIAAMDERSLRALVNVGPRDDAAMADVELRLREANARPHLSLVPVTAAEDEAWDRALGGGRH